MLGKYLFNGLMGDCYMNSTIGICTVFATLDWETDDWYS